MNAISPQVPQPGLVMPPPPPPIVDAIGWERGGPAAYGSFAEKLLAQGFRASAMRSSTVLRKDEWKLFDAIVIEVARQRLVGVGDLLSRGLRMDVPDALGVLRIEWEQSTDMTPAAVSMDAVTDIERDRLTYNLLSVPLPVVHKDFTVNIRALHASRKLGTPMDVTQAARSTTLVTEMNEQILFQGASVISNASPIYGYKTAVNRNTGSLISRWDDRTTTTGEEIVTDVFEMIAQARGDNMYGPYLLYVPDDYFIRLAEDYKANSDITILQRVLLIPGIVGVQPTKNLNGGATGEVIMVQMTRDTVDMVVGMQPGMVSWEEHGGMVVNFKIMSIMVPRMKYDASLQSGIVHHSV